MRWLAVWLISLFAFVVHASAGCDVWRLIEKANRKDSEFWQQVKRLQVANELTPENVNLLLKAKQKVEPVGHVVHIENVHIVNVEVQRQVEKIVSNLKIGLKETYNEALDLLKAEGIRGFYKNPGRWHLEKMQEYCPTCYGVRLNKEYRVLFKFEGSRATVMEVSKKVGHG